MGINLKDKAYSYIKEKIVNCEYMPGQVLVEAELMKSLNASRTPIREALNKLEQEHLVRIMPKRGVFVCDLTMSDVNQVFEVRELIEPYIIERYGHTLSKQALQRQCAKIKSQSGDADEREQYKNDDDLHKMLLSASGNSYMASIMDTIYTQNHRFRIISGSILESRLAETQREHLAICNHMLDGDFAKASQAMRAHLQNSKQATIDAMISGNTVPVGLSYIG